jgi:predicted outer membrane lipoprotein
LLDPQIVGPVAVAAFGWLTALLVELIDPKHDQSAAANEPAKPASRSGLSSIRRRRR